MAEGKKSFILYCDIKHTVDHLTDTQAGKLFKHIVAYVNDLDPQTKDIRVKLAFEPIKQQLKRDLRKWEHYIEKQSENGKLGGRPKKPKETQKTQAFSEKPKKADSVNVNVNDTVTNISHSLKPDKNFQLDLPEINVGAAIEYLKYTKNVDADSNMINSLWTFFKQKFFTGQKIYKSEADIFTHFLETLKFEKITNGRKLINHSTKTAGAYELLDRIKANAGRKTNP